jgi:hypothetical protein
MNVLHTSLLAAGLAAVAIPILIHLLMRRRRRPMAWGAMRFVLEAYRRTRRRLLVQRWLLLLARCLLVAALGVVLARPLLGGAGGGADAGRTVYLLIDNAIASNLTDPVQCRTALERHLEAARRVLAALGDADRAAVIPLARPIEPLILPASSNIRAVGEALSRIEPTDAGPDLAAALRLISERGGLGDGVEGRGRGAGSGPTSTVIVLSDFYAGSADLQAPLPRLGAGVRVLASAPAESSPGNTAISGVSVLRSVVVASDASLAQTATVTLERSGPPVQSAGVTRVALQWAVGGEPRGDLAVGQVRWTPGQQSATVTVPVETPSPGDAREGDAVLIARLDGDALSADDVWYLPVEARPVLRVGLISDDPARARVLPDEPFSPTQWLALALRPGGAVRSGIEITDVDTAAIDAPRLAGLDAAILVSPQRLDRDSWVRLRQFVNAGGLLVVTPPADQNIHTWPDAMNDVFRTGWRIAREPVVFGASPPRLLPEAPPDRGTPPAVGGATDPAGLRGMSAGPGDLLAPIRGELDELARSVTITRLLALTLEGAGEPGPGASGAGPGAGGAGGGGNAGEGASSGAGLRTSVQLMLEDRSPVLVAARPAGDGGAPSGSGILAYLGVAVSARWTDLPAKPLFLPLVQELVRQGVSKARPPGWVIAGQTPQAPAQSVELRPVMARVSMAGEGGTVGVTDLGRAERPLRHRAVYRAVDNRGGVRGVVAVNPDTTASRLEPVARPAVAAWLGAALPVGSPDPIFVEDTGGLTTARAVELLSTSRDGSPTGPLWILVVLALALVELGLARWASAGRTLDAGVAAPAPADGGPRRRVGHA